jgi:protein-L-isoaspartate(D-aspartate) O-methyltransferase
MTQELKMDDTHKVLEIGTGSGYQAAVTAKICKRLFTVERHLPLIKSAEMIFQRLHIFNITTLFGDGMKGWPEQAPFDRIMVTAAAEELPENLLEQLKDGGSLIIPIGKQEEDQFITKFTRIGDQYESQCLMAVKFVPLLSGIVHDS